MGNIIPASVNFSILIRHGASYPIYRNFFSFFSFPTFSFWSQYLLVMYMFFIFSSLVPLLKEIDNITHGNITTVIMIDPLIRPYRPMNSNSINHNYCNSPNVLYLSKIQSPIILTYSTYQHPYNYFTYIVNQLHHSIFLTTTTIANISSRAPSPASIELLTIFNTVSGFLIKILITNRLSRGGGRWLKSKINRRLVLESVNTVESAFQRRPAIPPRLTDAASIGCMIEYRCNPLYASLICQHGTRE